MKYLVNNVVTWRVNTVEEVELLHEELKNDGRFDMTSFTYKHKDIKSKGEIIDSYELVTAKLIFNDEKEPGTDVTINYEVNF